jgi:hypothetical protein
MILFSFSNYIFLKNNNKNAYFKQSREWRENTIGGDNVETATIYNNLGCCMLALERTNEALSYFDLSHALLDLHLGPYH